MITTEFITTRICDRCGAKVDSLRGLFISDPKPSVFQSSMCSHVLLMHLCLDCWGSVIEKIGPPAGEMLEKLGADVDRYRSLYK